MTALDFSGFQPQVVGKVVRLLMVLERIGRHPALKLKLGLHGGTVLNLFVLRSPRLSVDIDLNYVGNADREVMIAERPMIEKAVIDVASHLGFTVRAGAAEHAGRSFRLQYQGQQGSIRSRSPSPTPRCWPEAMRWRCAGSCSITFPCRVRSRGRSKWPHGSPTGSAI
ncbi:MAG: nucleotidyl transferase AbiEii/AbiGii toxin family protein [Bifidobacteriaceae bacterium]|nr:nucleotidyl transferase AbiEii/AbiGii toxin family protein [Bifidobacteriaceae bacterium]